MVEFFGRRHELSMLGDMLETVRAGVGAWKPGKCIMLRGRRRMGKSSLVEHFAQTVKVPSMYYTAAGVGSELELEGFNEAVALSTLPNRHLYMEAPPSDWNNALRELADCLPEDEPSLVIIDEVPFLMDQVEAFEGMLQRAWDRYMLNKPVLLLLIGSDLSMMEALNSYERPFFQRGAPMVLGPLNPAEIGEMLDLGPVEAFDAALVTGGLPLICSEWEPGASLWDFLARSMSKPVSALMVSAELSLAAEFPVRTMADPVLRAIANGERTFANIARAAGGLPHSTLARALETLVDKGIVTSSLPIALKPSRERRYAIADSYLRFWLPLIVPNRGDAERGQIDLVLSRIRRSWTSWRGRAIEPLVRESLARVLPTETVPYARQVGGFWTRSNDVEIDIIGAEDAPVAKELLFVGSVKWLDNDKFDRRDLEALKDQRRALTDQEVPLIGISRSGFDCKGLDGAFGPEDLIKGWQR
jgi:uncharacterized protein